MTQIFQSTSQDSGLEFEAKVFAETGYLVMSTEPSQQVIVISPAEARRLGLWLVETFP